MSNFLIFNIQLLKSSDNAKDEAGKEKYLELFKKLGIYTNISIKNKKLPSKSQPLTNNAFFATTSSRLSEIKYTHQKKKVQKTVALGEFEKFNEAKEVEELYSKEILFQQKPNQTAVSNRTKFRFVFDPDFHWIAIENFKGKLPNTKILEKSLYKFLQPIASYITKDYTLEINLISKRDSLESVLSKATGFKKIYAKIYFKNGPAGQNLLKEMAAKRLHKLEATASAAPKDEMKGVPSFMEGLLENVNLYGEAKINYSSDESGSRKFHKYSTKDNPELLPLRRTENESDEEYLARVAKQLQALAKSKGHA